MPHVDKRHGMFTWVDLNSPDQGAAKVFYCDLFGWNAREVPMGGEQVYVMFEKGGKSVAGLGQQSDAMAGMPAIWTSYVTVDDVDSAVARGAELGASITMPATDVMEEGRLALLQDPTGAVVGLWQDGEHAGAELFNEHGALTWNELATRDIERAKGFYGDLLGWSVKTGDVGDGQLYTSIFLEDGHPNGGMLEMDAGWPAEMPTHWMTYFGVDDVDAVAARAVELGGAVTVEPQDIAVGRFSAVRDPHGGAFSIISFTPA
jgi:predicted enzyme related to lactoylglutathione lyase